jgi:hypothetical protein
VRGADLLPSTPRQIFLQRALGVATPEYLHVPSRSTPRARSSPSRPAPRRCPTIPCRAHVGVEFLDQPCPRDAALARRVHGARGRRVDAKPPSANGDAPGAAGIIASSRRRVPPSLLPASFRFQHRPMTTLVIVRKTTIS